MTYGNLPYPDLPNLPAFLSQNPYERRIIQDDDDDPPLAPPMEEWDTEGEQEDDYSNRNNNMADSDKVSSSLPFLPMLRISNVSFSCDDPERTAFFVPLMILLVVHAMFLLYIHVYAPTPQQGDGEDQQGDDVYYSWEYLSLRGKRYYDVDGLKSSTAA